MSCDDPGLAAFRGLLFREQTLRLNIPVICFLSSLHRSFRRFGESGMEEGGTRGAADTDLVGR